MGNSLRIDSHIIFYTLRSRLIKTCDVVGARVREGRREQATEMLLTQVLGLGLLNLTSSILLISTYGQQKFEVDQTIILTSLEDRLME